MRYDDPESSPPPLSAMKLARKYSLDGRSSATTHDDNERTGLLVRNNTKTNNGAVNEGSFVDLERNDRDRRQAAYGPTPPSRPPSSSSRKAAATAKGKGSAVPPPKHHDPLHLVVVYTIVNTIVLVPGAYGYAAVIFNNEAFRPYRNALSKLILFSAVVHQAVFALKSSIPFAIGQVQDAGIIFLSAMANTVADELTTRGASPEEIVSTTVVLIGAATSALGVALVLMGTYRLAGLVSYLPLPVVGGYLAFIGYFCLEAGVGLCVGRSVSSVSDWAILLEPHLLVLALPGIVGGLAITVVPRYFPGNDLVMPFVMSVQPLLFYAVVSTCGGMRTAAEYGWVDPPSASVSPRDVLALVNLKLVHWDLAKDCLATWAGMVFVVSFSSCLDVAAISLDMGEALDTDHELSTVGLSNLVAGLFCGSTGSYIFSSTIFTYRTGMRTRRMGWALLIFELAVFFMAVNILEVVPLFFLGAGLIFIGFDLFHEWIVESRTRLLLDEYLVLVGTFLAINVVGINAGIAVGLVVASLNFVVTAATESTFAKTVRRSRAFWSKAEYDLLETYAYNALRPAVVTLELRGNVFFGSSLQLLTDLTAELRVPTTEEDRAAAARALAASPVAVRSPYGGRRRGGATERRRDAGAAIARDAVAAAVTPDYVVLDMKRLENMDASAARGCFLQLAKICAKQNVVVCASGANRRVAFLLRRQDVAYEDGDEASLRVKRRLLGMDETAPPPPANNSSSSSNSNNEETTKLLLFDTDEEALEFCENCVISNHQHQHPHSHSHLQPSSYPLLTTTKTVTEERFPLRKRLSRGSLSDMMNGNDETVQNNINNDNDNDKNNNNDGERYTLSAVLEEYLGLDSAAATAAASFHDELSFRDGESVFAEGSRPDSFFVVLRGSVVLSSSRRGADGGARPSRTGTVFGFVDLVLERDRRAGTAVAVGRDVVVARIRRSDADRDPDSQRLVDRLLLQVSVRELANTSDRL